MGKRVLWPGVLHGCYRGSRLETAGVTAMLETHRLLGTWRTRVNLFIALSEFSRRKFIEGGIPEERIAVKPNFVSRDPGPRRGEGTFALFAGRLSAEKGVRVLLDAWRGLPDIPLSICGDGPMRDLVARFGQRQPGGAIRVLPARSRLEVFELMKEARFLVFPSTCYENFPMAIADAFACGLPVLATDIGSAPEIVDNGRTGVLFRSGDPANLAAAARRLWQQPSESRAMGAKARAEFLSKYTAEDNYARLMNLYARVRDEGGGRR